MLLGKILNNPGSGTWIVLSKREQKRPLECVFHTLKFSSFDGAACQRVFDNTQVYTPALRASLRKSVISATVKPLYSAATTDRSSHPQPRLPL